MTFKESRAYTEMWDELRVTNALHEIATFECYTDGVFTYEAKVGPFIHELTFIADSTLLPTMSLRDILELPRVDYIKHTIRDANTLESLGDKEWFMEYEDCDSCKGSVGGVSSVSFQKIPREWTGDFNDLFREDKG